MAYDPGAIDSALAAAVGDEPLLITELRASFVASAHAALAELAASRDERGWIAAAWRLKGLAASFDAVPLMTVAAEAAKGRWADRVALARVSAAVDQL